MNGRGDKAKHWYRTIVSNDLQKRKYFWSSSVEQSYKAKRCYISAIRWALSSKKKNHTCPALLLILFLRYCLFCFRYNAKKTYFYFKGAGLDNAAEAWTDFTNMRPPEWSDRRSIKGQVILCNDIFFRIFYIPFFNIIGYFPREPPHLINGPALWKSRDRGMC